MYATNNLEYIKVSSNFYKYNAVCLLQKMKGKIGIFQTIFFVNHIQHNIIPNKNHWNESDRIKQLNKVAYYLNYLPKGNITFTSI